MISAVGQIRGGGAALPLMRRGVHFKAKPAPAATDRWPRARLGV